MKYGLAHDFELQQNLSPLKNETVWANLNKGA
jgi:hypothetical protein